MSRRMSPGLRQALRTLVVLVAVALVLAFIGALIWSQVVDLPRFTRTADGTNLDEVQLGKYVGIDGWYVVIAAIAAAGLAIVTMRRTTLDPVAAVLMITAVTLAAGWVMARAGLVLGPPDPASVAPTLDVGQSAPVLLKPHAERVLYAWPVAALIGSLLVLLGPLARRDRRSSTNLTNRQPEGRIADRVPSAD